MVMVYWHTIVLLFLVIAALAWCLRVPNEAGFFGSPRDWALALWVICTVVAVLIYGGFVWW